MPYDEIYAFLIENKATAEMVNEYIRIKGQSEKMEGLTNRADRRKAGYR